MKSRLFVLSTSLSLLLSSGAWGGEKENLGRKLFFDKRLSVDASTSCASCHRPDRAFTDGAKVSIGVGGKRGKLNAPTVLNRAKSTRHFWDGRAGSLETQAEGPLLNPVEMGNTREGLEERINALPEYQTRFAKSFGVTRIRLENIAEAIAAYEKTLRSVSSLYDEWKRGRREKWTPEHEMGRQLFFGRAGCWQCHSGPNFTNDALLHDNEASADAWKVPSLRELLYTAPYFHDGRYQTLDEVLEQHQNKAGLKQEQRRAIVQFLNSLSGEFSR